MKLKYNRHLTDEGWEIMISSLRVAFERAGGKSKLARGIGVEKNLPTNWVQKTRILTPEQAFAISIAYGVAKKSLRPDIDWEFVKLDTTDLPPRMLNAPDTRRGMGLEPIRPSMGAHGHEPEIRV